MRRLTPGGAELHPVQLDLTDEEAQRSEKSLTNAIENKALSAVAARSGLARSSRQVRTDRSPATATGPATHSGGARPEPAPAGAITAG